MDGRLVILGIYSNALAAHSVRILLEASGIRALVTGDLPSEHGIEQIRVLVSPADLALAIQVVEEVPPASEVLIPEWTCHCGATVDAGFHCCWSCGTELDD